MCMERLEYFGSNFVKVLIGIIIICILVVIVEVKFWYCFFLIILSFLNMENGCNIFLIIFWLLLKWVLIFMFFFKRK